MSDRSYGIPGIPLGGYTHSSERHSPPKPPAHAPQPAYSQSSRDLSPLRSGEYSSRAPGPGMAAMSGGMAGYQTNSMQPNGSAQALRDIDNLYNPRITSPSPDPYGRYATPSTTGNFHGPSQYIPAHRQTESQNPFEPPASAHPYTNSSPSHSSSRLGAPAAGVSAAGMARPDFSGHMPRNSYYGDGYEDFDPSSIADDGDDGIDAMPRHDQTRVAAGAGAGSGMLGAFGARNASGGVYGPVGTDPEKSAWLSKQSTGNKRLKWIVGIIIVILIVGAVIGGVVGGILGSKDGGSSGGSSGGGSSDSEDLTSGGLYDKNSKEVKAVLNNKNLHKVFPAMDYTPNYAQYPQCLAKGGGPIQNNVTIDVAIMSQLTPAIRLYGTDCNQTELVLEAIDRLDMKDSMKVWLGVYLNGNATTDDRQINAMYDILDKYDHSSFVGVIVGNEVLFAKYLTASQLQTQLQNIRANLTSKGVKLPVSTADLGDNWTAELAEASDIVMANVHPFFAGTVASASASWAYGFWQGKDIPLKTAKTGTAGDLTYPTQIISEIGWPSEGGNDCGDASQADYGCTSKTAGAVASIANLNTFMADWVCGALDNGTTFFWFEAFDEPWKHSFDTEFNGWEPFWGLFDVGRNLKDGVEIPDCGGKTVDKPY